MSIELVKEKLKTNQTYQIISDHLIKQCELEPEFINKILNEKKSLSECFDYMISEAKKLATNNVAMVDDATALSWAVHYFDEEELEFKKVIAQMTTSLAKGNKQDDEALEEDFDGEETEDIESEEEEEVKPKLKVVKTKPVKELNVEATPSKPKKEKQPLIPEGQLSLF